jgi:hypothetical protein
MCSRKREVVGCCGEGGDGYGRRNQEPRLEMGLRLEEGKGEACPGKGSLIFSQNRGGRRLPYTKDRVRENFWVFCVVGFSPSIAKLPPFVCVVETSIYR